MIKETQKLDPAHAVLESHKIFVKALQTIEGDTGNAAAVITKFRHRFKNEKSVWSIHGLRNRIAHETEVKVTVRQAHNARQILATALKSLSR